MLLIVWIKMIKIIIITLGYTQHAIIALVDRIISSLDSCDIRIEMNLTLYTTTYLKIFILWYQRHQKLGPSSELVAFMVMSVNIE